MADGGVLTMLTRGLGSLGRKAYAPTGARTVGGGWSSWAREPFAGAWQMGVREPDPIGALTSFSAVFACIGGISSDVAKLRIKLMHRDKDIWAEKHDAPQAELLTRPNRYETRLQFVQHWLASKLLFGNAYVLKVRADGTSVGRIVELHVLDPRRVTPVVTADGGIYYRINLSDLDPLKRDNGQGGFVVPWTDMIHDRGPTLWHPLVGVSPITACGMSTTMGNRIQANSAKFFENMSRPGGVLVVPGEIDDPSFIRMKNEWNEKFSGGGLGMTAVLTNGTKYEPFAIPAQDAQLIEQLRWTVEDVARAFQYPAHRLSNGTPPGLTSVEALESAYFSQTLQSHIEGIELCLDRGLELPSNEATEFDLDGLLRMDTAARFSALANAVNGGWLAPNEARRRENLPPVDGGDSPYLQQQNYSLSALAKRDASADPFAGTSQRTRSQVQQLRRQLDLRGHAETTHERVQRWLADPRAEQRADYVLATTGLDAEAARAAQIVKTAVRMSSDSALEHADALDQALRSVVGAGYDARPQH